MNRQTQHSARCQGHSTQSSRRAFTLIELMVVIGIIALLVVIALPAYTNVRKQAKVATTKATIGVLDTGITSFRTDTQLGGSYPMSYHIPSCINPYDPSGQARIDATNVQASHHNGTAAGNLNGAEMLAWALAGADQLGTPGFKNVDGSSLDPDQHDDSSVGGWTSDTIGGQMDLSSGGAYYGKAPLYSIDNTSQQPGCHRNSFVDMSKMKLPVVPKGLPQGTLPYFEFQDLPKSGGNYVSRPTISFLDAFGAPILYYRANRAAALAACYGIDVTNNGYPAAISSPLGNGIYQLGDNQEFTGQDVNGQPVGELGLDTTGTGAPIDHKLGHLPGSITTAQITDPTQTLPTGSFWATLQNNNVTAKRQPYREDSYILISAGPDGLYGTGDDITNINQ